MLDIHFNYTCAIYIYIYSRAEMREGPVSHRGTVERMIATQSSLFCCVPYLWVRLTICELTLMLHTAMLRSSFDKKRRTFLPEVYQ